MLLRFDATNGGTKFSEIADEVILLDIIEQPAEMDVQTARYAGGSGMRVSSATRTALKVQLVYVIRTQDPVRWAAVHDLVAKWATNASKLTVSTRPGKMLAGKFYTLPARNSVLRWTDELTMTFVAYEVPFWQDANMSISAFISSGETAQVNCMCTADRVPVELMITNDTNTPITEIIVTMGNSKMHLKGLELVSPTSEDGGIQVEHSLVIEAKDGHTTRIFMTDEENTSWLHTRTPDSSDVLYAITTEPTLVYFWADQPATCWLSCRRWWL